MRIFNKDGSAPTHVQVYGERNSATTYLRKLLQDNMQTPKNFLGALESEDTPLGHRIFGYKHWFIDQNKLASDRQSDTLFVVIYRNPYTWVRAMMDRPYALSKSISGKSVADLMSTKLTGHLKGRDTSYEFDPDTGEKLTLFELRQRKIECFERIKQSADCVVYLRLEELLDDPAGTITKMANQFPTAFAQSLRFDRLPYKQLMAEYQSPQTFSDTETALLDDAIEWRLERKIGYQKGSYGSETARTKVIVLHGGSSVGKSYMMDQVAKTSSAFQTLEMDACKYWEEATPRLSIKSLRQVMPDARVKELNAFKAVLKTKSLKTSRCVHYLLSELGKRVVQNGAGGRVPDIVATCGALPGPADPQVETIYSWLETLLPVSFHHVLIDIPAERHQQQIEQRGRTHLKSEIDTLHAKMVANRRNFDAAVFDFSGLAAFLDIATKVRPAPKPMEPQASTPLVRIKRQQLSHVQIYGERSSGTKYLTSLISENMIEPGNVLGSYASKKDPVNKAKRVGYKHYYPNPYKLAQHQHEILFLVIHKNPYTWIRSMQGKPYHFKACLDGKGILDLPETKLAGFDIHGREIPDVHPQSGELLTLFDLRKHKILEWEKLTELVENVAYVNYEHLLLRPTEITQSILDAFPSLFARSTAKEHIPDQHYISKYVTPKPFSDAEMAVMDAHIDWETEAILGYQKGNLFI